jgi:UDP-glucose 4-epimerase
MNILLTGAFGNIGTSALAELVRQGHRVRCFDLRTKTNEQAARKLGDRIEPAWGDLRRPDDVLAAVQGQDVVLHLAFILPKLSATGVESEKRPDWAQAINVGGTQNIIDAARAQPVPPRLVFASSLHVYGHTQHMPPPRTAADPVQPVEHYARHKVECEQRVRASGLTWTILRFAATLPLAIRLDPGLFDVPLDNRIEFAHTRDVGLAVANAASSRDVWGRLLLVGGGPRCQYYYREIVERVLGAAGVGMLPAAAFSTAPFATDWLDTAESQRLLCYQQRDLDDYAREMTALLGRRVALARAFRPLVRYALVRRSPYFPWPRSWMWQRHPVPQTI